MGYVYFMSQPCGSIKIGFTNGDPRLRLRALKYETGVELTLIAAFSVPLAQQVEQEIHSRLTAHRITSELYPETVARVELERMRASAPAWSPQSPTWNRDVVVRVRVTPDDERNWKLAADRAGMSLSRWIREMMNDICLQRSATGDVDQDAGESP